ncbi:hypothetical protein D3C71_2111260 [compost metagenome]
MLGDVSVVEVVARVRTQLGGATVEVTDLQLEATPGAKGGQHQGSQQCSAGPLAFGESVKQGPQPAEATVLIRAGIDT